MEPRHLAVTAIGNDRPGIVAAVTRALFEAGCNLEDATSTILRGHFSMMLVVGAPEGMGAPELEERLLPVGRDLELVITARAVDETSTSYAPPTHMVSVYGADRPGIVFKVAEHLARHEANITDLTSRIIGSDEHPVYALMLEVSLGDDADEVERDLAQLKAELGVEVSVRPMEPDVL